MQLTPWPAERDRPWPTEIDPGLAPSGLVFRVYALDGELIHEDRIGLDLSIRAEPGEPYGVAITAATAPIEASAARAADAANAHDGETCLVVYDGDTGQRVTWPEDDEDAAHAAQEDEVEGEAWTYPEGFQP